MSNCPETENPIRVKTHTTVARRTMVLRSSSLIPFVMVRKTGIVPNGFVSVKKEVKHKRAKGSKVSIITMI